MTTDAPRGGARARTAPRDDGQPTQLLAPMGPAQQVQPAPQLDRLPDRAVGGEEVNDDAPGV